MRGPETSVGAPAFSPRGRRLATVAGAVVALLVALALHAGAASAATPPQALILGDTVTPGLPFDVGLPGATSTQSLEEYEAVQDGFVPTVVDGTTWDSMTAAQFAQYQVLIIGDPDCGPADGVGDFQAAVANESTWEPVVMGSGGNKVIIGTDPVFHWLGGSGPNADVLVAHGISYAGAVSGGTGAYVDLSCTYTFSSDGTPVPLLDGLSTHGAGQFTVGGAPCSGAIAIIAATGPTAGLSDSDLSNWECSVHEFFDTFPADYTPLALATDPSVPVTYTGTDVSTGGSASGSPYILISGGGITISSNLALNPPTQTLDTSTSGTVTATLVDSTDSTPIAGASVTFDVSSGPDAGQTFTGTTDSSGQVSFTYTNSGTAGTDQILATADVSGVTSQGTASITWQTSAASPTSLTTWLSGGSESGATISVPSGTAVTDSSTLSGTNASTATGSVTYNVYSDSACTDLVSDGTAQTITTPGTLPDSQPVTLSTQGTYYWQAAYSGDSSNSGSTSSCGTEVETVTAPVSPEPTSTFTALSGGGSTAPQIAVAPGTGVSDQATLTGANTATAGGTVTYTVYSDAACMTPAAAPITVPVTDGSVPASSAVLLPQGTYWWVASYSGDALNDPSYEPCGFESEVVLSSAKSGADVGVQLVVVPGATVSTTGESVICVTVTNYGPAIAKTVVAGLLLPSSLHVDNAGGGLQLGRLVGWYSGTLGVGTTITYHVWVNPTASASGNASIVAGALSLGTPDPNYKNNLAAEKLTYMPPMGHVTGHAIHASSPLLARLRSLRSELRARARLRPALNQAL
jgi:hypothetical protein